MLSKGRSQFGEDLWILENYCIKETGIFIDIGASDGLQGSNSLLFEELGWWCLCIEPDPRHWETLVNTRRVCESLAVSDKPGEAILWLHPVRPSRSSLVPSEDVTYKPISIKTTTLAKLVEKYNLENIDIIDIDVEGHELTVWSSLDLSCTRPALVIIEYADTRPGSSFKEINLRLISDGYNLVHRTSANLIYESFDSHFKRKSLI